MTMRLEDLLDNDELADAALVGFTAEEMASKLRKARLNGRNGWWNPEECDEAYLRELLREHVRKANPGNYIDIVNFAAMLHWRDVHD